VIVGAEAGFLPENGELRRQWRVVGRNSVDDLMCAPVDLFVVPVAPGVGELAGSRYNKYTVIIPVTALGTHHGFRIRPGQER
jgi:hypothetical protein